MRNISKKYIDTIYLSIALLSYAFFSSSTPDTFGIAEVIIAIFLILFVGLKTPLIIFQRGFQKTNILPQYLYIIFFLLLIVPLFTGVVIRQNDITNAIRDIIPYVYLFIPILFSEKMLKDPGYWAKVLLILISIIGISFSIRHLLTTDNLFELLGKQIIVGNKEYFPMDPAVLFTSTILTLLGLKKIIIDKNIIKGATLLFGGLLAYVSLVAIMVRAQIILVLFSLFIYLVYLSKRSILMAFFIILWLIFFIDVNFDLLHNLYELMVKKFENVGLSNRDAEFIAVIENISESFTKLLFGEGWGGTIELPTSPGSEVRFTHNIFNYFIFKAGFIGEILIFAYFMFFVSIIFKLEIDNNNTILYLVFINIILVHFFLEPGYKMMSIGLILMYFILYVRKVENAKNFSSYSYL